MNSLPHPRAYMRSLATRQANLALSPHVQRAIDVVKAAGFDLVILETSGIGQSDTEIVDYSDLSIYVMTPEYGAATQLEKIDMLDFADLVAINKADKQGALDALARRPQAVQAQPPGLRRRRRRASGAPHRRLGLQRPGDESLLSSLRHGELAEHGLALESSLDLPLARRRPSSTSSPRSAPGTWPRSSRRSANTTTWAHEQSEVGETSTASRGRRTGRRRRATWSAEAEERTRSREPQVVWSAGRRWSPSTRGTEFIYHVRGREIRVPLSQETLSHTRVPKVALPRYRSWGDRLRWLLQENVPGEFPYTAGVFPFKRAEEDPARMFAGEGPPEQTNRRFHYLAADMPAKRLSTAFDSVTLYGEDPHERPDIYGKVGNSGVSIATLDDAKKLYSGFDLSDPATSVSMTINGPAPMILAFFMNAAIDQACERLHHRQRSVGGGRGPDRRDLRRPTQARATPATCPQATTVSGSGCSE